MIKVCHGTSLAERSLFPVCVCLDFKGLNAGAKVARGAGVGAPLGGRPQRGCDGTSPAERSSLPVCASLDLKGLNAGGEGVEVRKVAVAR